MDAAALIPAGLRRRWRWAAAAGLGLLFLPGAWRAYEVRHRAARLDAEIAALDAENQRLLAEMQRLQSDPTYIERVARRKLGRTRKGEVIYKVGPPPSDAPASSKTP
ncbi:MAG: septum formation initiator family protein [Candidatus Omnitrophica bacterium]|nr:septum formation initiator family protein [Candidatus Omnitrophota bacterium]